MIKRLRELCMMLGNRVDNTFFNRKDGENMSILSKISYLKIHMISTRVELRSTLNVLGIISDQKTEEKNKEDVFKVINLSKNLNKKDRIRLSNYAYEAKKRI